MNTIQVTTADGVVNYTESEVLRFIERVKAVDELNELLQKQSSTIRSIKNNVRDFFSEGEWCAGETTVTKGDVNMLLDSIGAAKLTTTYRANYTITGTFSVEVEDEDDIESLFTDNVSVDFYDGTVDVDQVEVMDIEEGE